MRMVRPQPRLLAQVRAGQPPAPALSTSLKPNVSIAVPAAPDDPKDPFVVAQAATLNHDPNQIYAFVRDQIKLEAYLGLLRGARGTLWAMAGNPLDKAVLLSALLQASNFTTQYKHTFLNSTPTGNQTLININRGMFPQTPVLLGCIPSTAATDDPGYNGYADSWNNDYYWVEYGPSNIDLDPNIPGGQPGQTVQAADATYATTANLPASEMQQVTVNINVELYSQASSLFGFGPATTTVLTQQFYSWQLVGNIISAGNLVQSTSVGGLDISATTFTYTPYLLIGSGGADISQDTIVTGTDYQEYYTNFPLSSQIVTGIFVDVVANDDWNEQQNPNTPYVHTLFDRIGPAARQGNVSGQISIPATPAPAVSNWDIATLNILPTRLNLNTFQAQQTRLNNAYQNYLANQPAFQALPTTGTLSAAQQLVAQQTATLAKYLLITANEMVTMAYDGAADQLARQLDTGYYVRIYPSAPRITVANSSIDSSGNALYTLDVLKNDMFVIDGYGQNRNVIRYEEVARGMIESTMEANILSQVTGATSAFDIGTVLGTLGDPNQLIGLGPSVYYNPQSIPALSATTLSADAQTLIVNAVQAGDQIITPNQMVTINGVPTVGWWEMDQFGHTVSHFPNGNHQAIAEYTGANEFAQAFNKPIAKFIGQVEGVGLAAFAFASAVLQTVAENSSFSSILKSTKSNIDDIDTGGVTDPLKDFFENYNKILKKFELPEADPLGTGLIDEFASGLEEGIEKTQEWLDANIPFDPEVSAFLTTPLGPLPTGVTPGSSPGVTITTSTDTVYTMPFNGNELPVYDVFVTNTGPNTDTFNLQPYDTSGHFRLYTSVSALTLLPGQQGEVNLCAVPYDTTGVSVPAVGATGNFQVTATSPTSNATLQAQIAYTVPAIPTVAITVDPQAVTVSPGGTVNATLTITSVGNAAPGPITLTAVAAPGVSIGGLTSPVSVALNGATAVPVSFTAAANAAHSVYNVVINTSYTAVGGTQTIPFSVPVTVQSLGTCTLNAALTATQTGASSLGSIFSQLANDMNAAAGAPSNPAFVSRIAGDLAVVNNSLADITYLQAFTASITTAGSAVASANSTNLLSALNGLDAAICPIGTTLSQASSFNTQIYLNTNSLVTGPGSPANFTVTLSNPSNTTKVYNLAVSGVPSGVNAQFNTTTVNVGPSGQYTSNSSSFGLTPVVLTLTPGATFTTPFTFSVIATPVGAPEFAISATGSLLVRPQQISIDNVTATPAYGPAGTQFVITARVFAEVNENETAYLTMQPYTAGGTAITFGYQSPNFNLTTTSTLQTVTIATIDSTSFANGAYTLAIQGYNNNNGQVFSGATASGSFLVGAPLSGTLTANPNSTPPGSVPPGNSAAQVSLNISRDTVPNPVSTLVGTVAMSGTPRSMTLYQNGAQQLAYVCSDSVVNIVDVTHPANMSVVGTFAGDILTTENGVPGDPTNGVVTGFQVMACSTFNTGSGTNFAITYSRFDGNNTAQPIPTHFATYSLANPLAPVKVGSVVDIPRGDSAGLYIAGTTALMYQSTTFYNPYSNFIFAFTGDIWAAGLGAGSVTYDNDVFPCGGLNSNNVCNNVTNVPSASLVNGVCTVNGTTAIPNDQTRGGPYRIGLGTAVNSTTTYFASSNSVNGTIENPSCPTVVGQLLVVDTTTPTSPKILSSVPDPAMAFMTGIAVQGNLAVAVGDSTGIYDINSGYVGTLVISAFDITNRTNPTLTSSIATQLTDVPGSFIVPLGSTTFAVGNTSLNKNAELVLVDASNPNALRYIPYNATFVANPTIAQNGFFFALSGMPSSTTNSLSAFQLTQITGPQLTVKLNLPTTGNAIVDPTSFSLTPTKVTTGTSYNTYEWDQPTPNTISFNVNLTGVNPGDVPTVVTGGEMDYTLPSLGPGTFVLPPLTVLCQQILSISPATQTVQNAGNSATYQITISNPTTSSQTFVPSTLGIPASWGVQLPASVTVTPGRNQPFNLVLTTPLNAPPVTYSFFVTVATAGGINGSVGGMVVVQNVPTSGSGNVNTNYVAYTAAINPSTVTVGQQGSVTFQVAITNTGTLSAGIGMTYANSYSLPSGWQLNFQPTYSPTVLPGLANTVTITGTLTLPPTNYNSTTPGQYVIPLQAAYYGAPPVNIPLTVNIVGSGAYTYMSPGSGSPATAFNLVLTNTGSASDEYNFSLVGPLAQVATIPSPTASIAAGAQIQVPITFNAVDFVSPGNYILQVKSVSQTSSSVISYATATVTVSGSKGVSAAISPSSPTVGSPGSVSLLFQANNTGNVPDTYTASITGTTGSVNATLSGAQSIAAFAIPALGNSEFPLNATLNGAGPATVTVKVTSLSNSSITGQATVTINTINAGAPTAVASPAQANTSVHRLAVLSAAGSSDPNNLALTYLWTLSSAPAGSALNSASIALANSVTASFRPDVLGTYSFNVKVSDGSSSSNATATYTAVDELPVAVPANNFNTRVGAITFLTANNSYDPDGQPISFAWSLVSAPTGSAIASTSNIDNSQTPNAFFTPDVAGAYQFQLIVSDPSASSLPAMLTVTAAADGSVPPNANAGASQNIAVHSTATVNGSASVDPNSSPLALTYQWTFGTIPSGSTATLSNANTASAQFTPDVAGAYTVSLVVSNAHGTSAAATATVYAFTGDVPPNANAGANQFVTPTSTASLSSQGSADPDSGPLNLSYLWWLDSLPFASTAAIQHPTTASPAFVADQSGYYIARLEANDGLLAGFANTLVTSAATCDADANGVINSVDIALIRASFGQSALPNDPRDYDHNGIINQSDATNCNALISSATPNLQVQSSSITKTVAQGSAAVLQTLQVSSTGNPIGYTVQSSQPWITANVTSDNTSSISTMAVTLNPSGLTASTTPYTGTVTFTPSSGATVNVPVSLTVTAPLQISPTSFTEDLVQGAAAVMQPLSISTGGGAISFSVQSDSSWLTTSIGSGSTSTVSGLNAIVTPGTLTPNTYTRHLTFTPGGEVVTVTLTITAPGPVTPSPTALTFSANYGGPTTASQPVQVTSTGGPVSFSVASDEPWLSAGVTTGLTPQQLNVTASPATVTPGSHTGHLTLTSGTNTSTVTVTFTVTESGSACDVNQDGQINVADVQKLINEALGTQSAANDLTSDGVVNAVDVQIDINAVLQLGCSAH